MAVCNSINLSEIQPDRFDAEYFRKDYQDNLKQIKKCGNTLYLGKLFKYINRGTQPLYDNTGNIKALRSVNVGFMNFNETRQEFVTEDFFEKSNRGKVERDDILITSTGVGTLGRTSIWFKDEQAFCDGHITILRDSVVDPYCIVAFLNSKYGLAQFDQNYRGSSGQIEIYPFDISKFQIPECLVNSQIEIGNYLKSAFKLQSESNFYYNKAIDLIEKELGLENITFDRKKNYTASFSEVATTRRMNAEYFSPLVKKILSQSFLNNSKPISSIFQIVRGNTPKQYFENGFPVIKTKNVRVPEIDRERVSDFVQSTKDLTAIQENDLLLASMGVGSLGRMSYVFSLDEDMVVDGTIRVFRRKSSTPINYEIPTLLFLSTKVGQELIYRGIVGSTGIISLPDDYLSKIPIPHFPEELCLELTRLVKESMMAKRESKRLLEEAKTRVEQLIEEAANKN